MGPSADIAYFIKSLNQNNLNIKLTSKAGRHGMDFLDVLLDIDSCGYIQSDVYRKPTSANTLLHAQSSHPKSIIKSIPTGQAADLNMRFQQRGYSDRDIQSGYRRAKYSKRKDLLYNQGKRDNEDIVRFISTFNARNGEMWQALKRYWKVLQLDPVLSLHLSTNPAITYRRSKNFKDHLVKSHLGGPIVKRMFGSKGPSWGCRPCGSCVACPNIDTTKVFSDSSNTKEFKIVHTITCTTVGIIYCARCPCNKLYVGLTTRQLRRRVREHVLDIKAAREVENFDELKTLPRHFKRFHNSDPSGLQLFRLTNIQL
ncbi:uncharacterized protein [Phyllobates terribilis]|uniref:uncharacterized protein n=1 Tax=Phyllobates terribilis TaxID=111132 RepID=UPI003CCAA34B